MTTTTCCCHPSHHPAPAPTTTTTTPRIAAHLHDEHDETGLISTTDIAQPQPQPPTPRDNFLEWGEHLSFISFHFGGLWRRRAHTLPTTHIEILFLLLFFLSFVWYFCYDKLQLQEDLCRCISLLQIVIAIILDPGIIHVVCTTCHFISSWQFCHQTICRTIHTATLFDCTMDGRRTAQ